MKKMLIYQFVGIIIFVTILMIIVVRFFCENEDLIFNIKKKCDQISTNKISNYFHVTQGDEIKIIIDNKIKKGSIKFVIKDNKGNVVCKFSLIDKLEQNVYCTKTEKYTLEIIYEEYQGEFDLKIIWLYNNDLI